MAKQNNIEIIITAVDKATGVLGGIGNALGNFGKGVAITTGALFTGGVAAGKWAFDMASAAAPVEMARNTFDSLAASIGEDSESMLNDIREATSGMVSDQNLMAASNKFTAMGIADTSDEVAKLTGMATNLSLAMGMDATQGAADFAAMLANQSIPRLDNFGISSGNVRARIEELMTADKNLTTEQAFLQAVMEEGDKTMQKVGDQSGSTAGQMATFQTSIANLQASIGTALLPILSSLATTLTPIITAIGPSFIAIAGSLGSIFTTSVVPALGSIVENLLPVLMELLPTVAEIFGSLAGDLLSELVPALLQLIGAFLPIIKLILPPLISLISTVVGWLVSKLVPVIQVVAEWLGKALPVAFKLLSNLWTNTLRPALDGLWTFLLKVWDAFKKIGEAVGKVIQFFKDLVAGIKNIKLPDWLTPGSPTPFEIGLRGIADALQDVNGITSSAFNGLPERSIIGAAPGGSVSNQPMNLSVHIHTPINLADRSFAERELMPYIEAGVRQLIARSA